MYHRGLRTPEEAYKVVNKRIQQVQRGSIAIKRLREFRKELLKEHPELRTNRS